LPRAVRRRGRRDPIRGTRERGLAARELRDSHRSRRVEDRPAREPRARAAGPRLDRPGDPVTTTERHGAQSIMREDVSVSEHAVLIPTSAGPVGAIVTEPRGASRLGVVLFPGGGDAGRSGINASWARAARAIADRGLTVLRFDYPGARESGVGHVNHLEDLDEWLSLGRRRYLKVVATRHR